MERLNGIISRIKEKNFEAYIHNGETIATIDILRNRKGDAEVWTRYYIELGARSRRLGFVRYLNDCVDAWDLNDGSAEEIIDWLERDIECDIFDRIERRV